MVYLFLLTAALQGRQYYPQFLKEKMETFTHLSKIIDPICDGKDSKKGLCDART